MQLNPLVSAFNGQVLGLKLNLLGGLVLLFELVLDVTVCDRGFADFFVADQDNFPVVVGYLVLKVICHYLI